MGNLSRNQLFQETENMVKEYLNHPKCSIIGKNWSKERLAKRYIAYSEMIKLIRQARAIISQWSEDQLTLLSLFPESQTSDDINAYNKMNKLERDASEIWRTQF